MVVVLSSISLSAFTEYRKNAYRTSALASCRAAKTAIEAAKVEDIGLSLFSENRAIKITPNDNYSCSSGCAGISRETVMPNYAHTKGVTIMASLISNTKTYTLQCGHCKALTDNNTKYDGWLIASPAARYAFSVGDEASECDGTATVSTVTTTTSIVTTTPSTTTPASTTSAATTTYYIPPSSS